MKIQLGFFFCGCNVLNTVVGKMGYFLHFFCDFLIDDFKTKESNLKLL